MPAVSFLLPSTISLLDSSRTACEAAMQQLPVPCLSVLCCEPRSLETSPQALHELQRTLSEVTAHHFQMTNLSPAEYHKIISRYQMLLEACIYTFHRHWLHCVLTYQCLVASVYNTFTFTARVGSTLSSVEAISIWPTVDLQCNWKQNKLLVNRKRVDSVLSSSQKV